MLEIPVIDSDGGILSALVDDDDATLARHSWTLSKDGYARRFVEIDGREWPISISMHREILGLGRGDPRIGDHRDGNRLNNRRGNLRILAAAENNQNLASQRGRTSQYRGVDHYRCRDGHFCWRARVWVKDRMRTVGYYQTEVEAARAVSNYRSRIFPYSNEARPGHSPE